MKVITVLGTRPEIIRLSLIIEKLDQLCDKHILVHTGQNFDPTLSDVFFEELNIRKPDYHFTQHQNSLGHQMGQIFLELEKVITKEKPDKALVLGDTNSALSAILFERMGIPVYHMEAGNRCYDLRVPEEKNRKIIDTISTYNLPYTLNSKENLLKEGFPKNRIFVTGNPINEVIQHYNDKIEKSKILEVLNLNKKDYFLVTIHRAENVDDHETLTEILNGLHLIATHFNKRMICSIHPRTKSKIEQLKNFQPHPLIEFYSPFGFFDFIRLEREAFCLLTDSGTVQEEGCIFNIPAVTIRKTTERPETVDCGSNMVSGIEAKNILLSVRTMVTSKTNWELPTGYGDTNVSEKVVKIILGGNEIV